HGSYLIIERILKINHTEKTEKNKIKFQNAASVCTVFIFTVLAWVPFRLPLQQAFDFYRAMLPTSTRIHSYGVILSDLVNRIPIPATWSIFFPDTRVLILIVVSIILDLITNKLRGEVGILQTPRWVQIVALTTALFLLLFLSLASYETPFIYQGF
ncbi:MAG TPA: hypothetical protein VN376_06800, partial [Longilinea sp.]|nr:hypothetical protein [Longilinea sp.]